MSIWEMNDRLNHKNPHHLGFRDLIWQFFNDEPPCTPLLYNYQFSNLRRIFKAHISCISSSEKSDDRFYRFCCMI